MKRKYWVISPNARNKGDVANWIEKSIHQNKVFVGYDSSNKLGERFENDVAVDDCVIIAQGAKDNRILYLIGIIKSERLYDDEEEIFFRSVNYLLSKKDIQGHQIYLDSNNAFFESNNPGTIYELKQHNKYDFKVMEQIEEAFKLKIEQQGIQDKIDILEYKKQIILQGPPGTGKTRMAKMIAEKMTKAEKTLTPFEYIEYFIKSYKESFQSNKYNEFVNEKLIEFTEEFPKDSIINLSLDQYCLGKGSNNSFCYWIEKGLKEIGRFSTGPAGTTVYGVYYSKDESKYISVIEGEIPDKAIDTIRQALSELILNENYTLARKLFRFSFILKILNSYYPENYFPIVSQKHLLTVGKIFGLDTTGLNDIDINKKIKDKFTELKTLHNSKISSYNLMGHLYEKFKIKDDQTGNIILNSITEIGETQIIQFHPAYSYEDFVRGIVVETNKENQIEYKVVDRTLAAFAKKALENPTANYVLIIDEINRANLPTVLGELIYALEYRYDEKLKNEKDASVESLYALKDNENDITGNKTLMLPTNLFIIGTMNTADRSVGHIDYAIKRRFAFVDVPPTSDAIDNVVKDSEVNTKAKSLFSKVANLFNEDDTKTVYLQSDFRAKDVQLGHSYFLAETEKQLELKLEFEIIPLLNEYVKDGILNESALVEIQNL